MSFTTGNNLKITIFGESHGSHIGITIEGIPYGFKIDTNSIKEELKRRNPQNIYSTSRKEEDFTIISGVFNEKATGGPITCIMPNKDIKSSEYNQFIPRPGHSDYSAFVKYNGYNDYRGGGFFSGRLTACLVFAGAICKDILKEKNIKIYSHILSVKNIKEKSLLNLENYDILKSLEKKSFPCIEKEREFLNEIEKYKNDSVGGIWELMVLGIPCGIGEPYFDSVESVLSKLFFSVPGIKGVEFGEGFRISELLGSQANDCPAYTNNKVSFNSNHSGGINGGISNGMPIICRVAVRPTPSISKEQDSINLETKDNVKISTQGRHDKAIIVRIAPIMEAMTAIGLCDLIL